MVWLRVRLRMALLAAACFGTTPATAQDEPAAGAAASAGSTVSTASISAGVTNYAAVLRAWLQDHMRYPRRAKLRNMQGTATLWLSIDAEGHVLDFRIQQSSAHSLLDSEVEALVRRADPMPPVPDAMQDSSIEFVVPVQFVQR